MSMIDTTTKVVTRFAPSPTGALHIGGARTALYAWAYARGRDGTFLLRLEDTDQKRSSEASAASILRDLKWLGLDWDNAGAEPRQSQRLDRYNEHIDKLLRAGRAYEDAGAVRFRMDSDIAIDDEVYGHVEVKAADLEDFVIRKADGFPTFHLAVVVDDADMGVTHVIRGQEHLSNTPKHAALFDAFGYLRPVFAHTPSIMNADGSKMSKRDKAKAARAAALKWLDAHDPQEAADLAQPAGIELEMFAAFMAKQNDDLDVATAIARRLDIDLPEINVADFRDSGYLPAVLCNYVTLLGWNPGGDVERYDMAFFREKFDFDRVNKSNSRFDRDKLLAFNGDTLAKLAPHEFAAALRRHLGEHDVQALHDLDNRGVFDVFAACLQPRSKTLEDPVKQGRFLLAGDDAITCDPDAVSKVLAKNNGEGMAVLRELAGLLAAVNPWTGQAAHDALVQFAQSRGLGMGKIAQPLRVAVSGSTVSPPIDATLAILGKAATLARIERCLSRHQLSA
jgi:glutamyl/glutaminyl-tRNA synthetase